MPSIKETLNHLQQVGSTRGGKMTIIIVLVSGAILGGIVIGLNIGAIQPLEELGRTFVTIVIFIFVFSFAGAIYFLIRSNSPGNLKNKAVEAHLPEEKAKATNIDLLGIWSRRISLGGTLILALGAYILGWFFVIKYLVSPTIHQISSGPVLWEMGTAPNSIGNIMISFMMFIIWIIMPFMIYMDFDKKQHERKARRNQRK